MLGANYLQNTDITAQKRYTSIDNSVKLKMYHLFQNDDAGAKKDQQYTLVRFTLEAYDPTGQT